MDGWCGNAPQSIEFLLGSFGIAESDESDKDETPIKLLYGFTKRGFLTILSRGFWPKVLGCVWVKELAMFG